MKERQGKLTKGQFTAALKIAEVKRGDIIREKHLERILTLLLNVKDADIGIEIRRLVRNDCITRASNPDYYRIHIGE